MIAVSGVRMLRTRDRMHELYAESECGPEYRGAQLLSTSIAWNVKPCSC
jgi:hypothetical protein